MQHTVIVAGHGPGISDAVARRFAREGHKVAIVARNGERLAARAAALQAEGLAVHAFAADLSNLDGIAPLVAEIRAALGPIGVLHWNVYTPGAGDLLTAPPVELVRGLNASAVSLVAAVQASLADLEANQGAVLVTGGGFAFYDRNVDAMAVQFQAMGLAIGKAAQHKAVGVLTQALAARGVYVGEVVVTGMVKGTAFDFGNATLDADDIATRFWELNAARAPASVKV